jgi:hypothetical protein
MTERQEQSGAGEARDGEAASGGVMPAPGEQAQADEKAGGTAPGGQDRLAGGEGDSRSGGAPAVESAGTASPAALASQAGVSQVGAPKAEVSQAGVPGREPPDPAAITRKLFMGGALILALLSIGLGMLGAPRALQAVMAAVATILLYRAFASPAGDSRNARNSRNAAPR